MTTGSPRTTCRGFTLVELIAAMSVLVILVLGVVQMLDNASSIAGSARRALENDDQARTTLDCISLDMGQIVKDVNVDTYFPSAVTTGKPSGAMFFYTGRQGYAAANATNLSGASLTGYRINANAASTAYNQLERYSATTQWDGDNTGSMVFLTYPTTGSFAPMDITTLAPNPVVAPTSTNTNFHVLGEDIFRMEFCYQLKDGTYSSQPVLYTTPPPAVWNAGNTFYHASTAAPTASNGDPTYEAGSRWYDSKAERGYLCTSVKGGPSSNQAVWRAIGWQDVAAVVVTVATMDKDSRVLVKSRGLDLQTVAKALPTVKNTDPTVPAVTSQAAQLWLAVINGTTLSALIPQRAVAGVRVYQRYIYLDAQ